jgi:peptide/nickel transport system substrate-binding protein
MTEMTIAQSRVELEDPHNCTDSNDVLTVFEALFEALVRFAPGGGFEPGLAERWTVSEDARVWIFFLRADAKFHNGEVADAEAVKHSLERMARPDMGVTLGAPGVYAQYLGGADIDVLAGDQVRVRTAAPLADLLDILVYGYILPPGALAEAGLDFAGAPVGSGPYQIESYEPGVEVTVRANAAYHGEAPTYERVTWRAYGTAGARLDALLSGAAQIATALAPEAKDVLSRSAGHSAVEYLSPTAYIYLLNAARGPLSDPRLRRALNLAVDRRRLIAEVLQGAGQPLEGFVSPVHFGAGDGGMDSDPEAARRLMTAAGYPDGLTLAVDCPTRLPDEAEALTAALARQLADVGIALEVHRVEDRTAYAHQVRLKQIHDLCVFDSSPMSTFRVLKEKIDSRTAGSWWQGYRNPDVEALLDKAAATVEPETRAHVYRHCYDLLQQDPPWLTLYNHYHLIGLTGSHEGWSMRFDGVLDPRRLP